MEVNQDRMPVEVGRGAASLSPTRFAGGLTYPWRALMFGAAHPSVWPYCIIPVLINVVVLLLIWHWSGHWVAQLQGHYLQKSTGWLWGTVHYLAIGVGYVIRVLLVLLSFVVVGNVASVPFNDLLSERVDRIVTGWRDPNPFSVVDTARRLMITMLQELKRMSMFLMIMVFLFACSWIPLLTPFTMAAKVFVTSAFLATDYFSYPLERRGLLMVSQKFAYTRSHLAPCLGFGFSMLLIGMIPLVQFLFLPLGVIGGTLLHANLERDRR